MEQLGSCTREWITRSAAGILQVAEDRNLNLGPVPRSFAIFHPAIPNFNATGLDAADHALSARLRATSRRVMARSIHEVKMSIFFGNPLRLEAQRAYGSLLKTPSSVCFMNSCHSQVAYHSSRAHLLLNCMRSRVSCMKSLGTVGGFLQFVPACGVSTGMVSNRVMSGK